MCPVPPSELRSFLLAEGFEIYRGLGDRLVLAERVRDNLIMDSGVLVIPGEELRVQFVVRAQAGDFPADSSEALFARARVLGAGACQKGYAEVASTARNMADPGDETRTLDVFYEVTFEKAVRSEAELAAELRYVLSLEKAAAPDSVP